MSRKNKKEQKFIYEKDLDNYYELNSEAVDTLVNASEETAPEVGKEELRQYRSGVLSRIPGWIKALFIKFWFNGAVCFFFLWGLSMFIPDLWDQMLVVGLAMGVVTDLLVNNAFRFMAEEPGANDKWMMVPQKKFWTLFVNIAYAMAVFSLEVLLYDGINRLFSPDGQNIVLGVEPFLFGLFYLLIDMAFIGMKNLIVKIVRDAKAKHLAGEASNAPSNNGLTVESDSAQVTGSITNDAEEEAPKQITVVRQVTPSGKKSKKKKK